MANTTTAGKQSRSQIHLSKDPARKTPASSDEARSPKHTAPGATAPGDELRAQIAQAAYYRALQRGFTPGFEVEDWVQAEAEVLKRQEGSRATN